MCSYCYRIDHYSCDHRTLLQAFKYKIFSLDFKRVHNCLHFLSKANQRISAVRKSPVLVTHSNLNSPIKTNSRHLYKYTPKVGDMLFAVNRISMIDVKKSGIILITTLSIAILISILLYRTVYRSGDN